MRDRNDFYTMDSLATFTGVSGATFVVANSIQAAFGWNPTWLALLVAQAICVGVLLAQRAQLAVSDARPPLFPALFVAIINGFLVYGTAAGLTSVGSAMTRPAAEASRAPGAASAANAGPERRGFLTPWP